MTPWIVSPRARPECPVDSLSLTAAPPQSPSPHSASPGCPPQLTSTDLTALLSDHIDDISGVTIGSYAFAAYADRAARELEAQGRDLDEERDRVRLLLGDELA